MLIIQILIILDFDVLFNLIIDIQMLVLGSI